MVHSHRSPLYFLTVISAADGQRLSSPPSPICRYVLLNTACGRRSRGVSRFGIFCGHKRVGPLRRPQSDAARRTVASVTGLGAGLWCGSWKGETAAAFHSADAICQDRAGAPQVSTMLHRRSWLPAQRHHSANFKAKGASEAKRRFFSLIFSVLV